MTPKKANSRTKKIKLPTPLVKVGALLGNAPRDAFGMVALTPARTKSLRTFLASAGETAEAPQDDCCGVVTTDPGSGITVINYPDGSVTIFYPNGNMTVTNPTLGIRIDATPDGGSTISDSDGNVIGVIVPPGGSNPGEGGDGEGGFAGEGDPGGWRGSNEGDAIRLRVYSLPIVGTFRILSKKRPELRILPSEQLAKVSLPFAQPKPRELREWAETSGDAIECLQAAFDRLRKTDQAFDGFVMGLVKARARAVVFGGWVRDHLVSLKSSSRSGAAFHNSKDVDVVVQGISKRRLRKLLPKHARVETKTSFQVRLKTGRLDVWRLEDTLFISKGIYPPAFESLPLTTVFKISSGIFKPKPFWSKPSLVEAGLLDALARRTIDFQSPYLALPIRQASRALIFSSRYRFSISPEVRSFISAVLRVPAWRKQVQRTIYNYFPRSERRKADALLKKVISGRTRKSRD